MVRFRDEVLVCFREYFQETGNRQIARREFLLRYRGRLMARRSRETVDGSVGFAIHGLIEEGAIERITRGTYRLRELPMDGGWHGPV